MDGNIEGTWRGRRRHEQLLHILQETRRYRKFNKEAHHDVWRSHFGRGYGLVVRHDDDDDDDDDIHV